MSSTIPVSVIVCVSILDSSHELSNSNGIAGTLIHMYKQDFVLYGSISCVFYYFLSFAASDSQGCVYLLKHDDLLRLNTVGCPILPIRL